MFDRIAGRYDALNRVISLGLDQPWRRRTIEALSLEPGHRVLDLATGTGDMAILAARAEPGVEVVGVDPSTAMLDVGRDKVTRDGFAERIVLREGDGEDLPFADDAFDAAMIAFGIRNVADRPRALREMARVVRPGGRIAILEANEPRRGPLAPLARLHVHHVMPRIGAWLSGAAEYRYLQTSIEAFPQPEAFADVMRAQGLVVERVERMLFDVACLFVARPAGPQEGS
ncbi:MAG: bifunctional demethylmenaquinone methyltransferase/2-methoxy-6-polyprenyl-1,4-benzoquinol methylase UbiE [Acidobacteriota bacterium]